MSETDAASSGRTVPVDQLSYTEASRELDGIVEFFEQRDVDVDQIVSRLERATAIVDELDKRIRRTRAQVEQLVPRLEAVSRADDPDMSDGSDRSSASGEADRESTPDDDSQLF